METELQKIRDARQSVYMPNGKLGIFLLLIIAGGIVHSLVGALFGIFAMVVVVQRIQYVAKLPCPKCDEPFGSNSSFPIGVGSSVCQNCGQHLYV